VSRDGAWTLLLPLLAAILAGALFAVFAHWRDSGGEGYEQMAVVAGLVFGASLLTGWGVRYTCRKVFRDLSLHVAALREKPSSPQPPSLVRLGRGLGAGPLTGPLQALADCYAQALERVVETKEALEVLRSQGGEHRPDVRRYPTFPFERSQQQMVGRLTPNLRWLAATPLLQQFLGRTMEQLNGRSFLHSVHREDRERVEKALGETFQEGENHNLVFRVVPPSSVGQVGNLPENRQVENLSPTPRYLQTDVLVYNDGRGRPVQLRCHFIDVTERVLAEKALRRRSRELTQANHRLQQINRDLERLKESYRDLYHNAPVMYFSLDEDQRFAAVNESLLRTLGYQREELLEQPYAKLVAPAARAVFERDPGVLSRPGALETSWVGSDGRVRDVWVGISTIKDLEGRVVRARCAAADITERNRLARAVVGRARDLEKANTQLRRINQELEEFTYVVSHDLKEPLRTLEAFSGFLAADYGRQLAGEGREYITHLTEASSRLGALIDDLLTLSRAGRVIGTPRRLNWDVLLGTVHADLQQLMHRRPGTVVRVEGPLPAAQGDPERITQLLANLVSNALKYNESAVPEVVIGAVANGDEAQATLFVRDNGMGIDPRYHEQIFRIFRRLHGRDQYEGTGAGLAICKKIVEAHAGRLWVESAVGHGSTFYFTLPLLVRGQRTANQPEAQARGPSLTSDL
jgi:PAS domain S-box-containing protein